MNASELLLGIDIGTSSVKAVFMDARGNVKGSGQREYPIDSPQIGRAEQPPEGWWKAAAVSVREGLDEARRETGGEAAVLAVGFSGQMHGLVALRHDDSPARPAIIWADQRSTDETCDVNEAIEKTGIEKTCNKASPGFLLPSLLWLMRREPETFRQIKTVMLPKDYICFRMTGRRVSEPTDAAGTCAYNVRDGGWNTGLLEALSLPSSIFPETVPTGTIVGQITPRAAEELGLPAGIPVAAGAADQPAGALGNGVIEFGTLLSTIGTAGQIFAPLTAPAYDERLRTNTFNHAPSGTWYALGANLSAGYCLKWLKRHANIPGEYKDLDGLASRVPAGSRGVIFLPYLFGDRTPHLDGHARATFFGLTGATGIDEMIRAVMEGVVFSMAEGLEITLGLGVSPKMVIASGGGARSKLWQQIQADIYNLPVTRSVTKEQACTGAAILAAAGAGIYPDIKTACAAMTRMSDEIQTPDAEAHAAYMEIFGIYRELYDRNRELFPRLAKFAT
jgi:xylulokinase